MTFPPTEATPLFLWDPAYENAVYLDETLMSPSCRDMPIHVVITLKGLIEQERCRVQLSHRFERIREDLDTLRLIAQLTTYRNAVNHLIRKYFCDPT